MRSVVISASLLLVLFQSLLGDLPENAGFDSTDRKCLSGLKISEEIIRKAVGKDFKLAEDNEDILRFLVCTWSARGYLKEGRNLDVGEILKWVRYSLLESIGAQKLESREKLLSDIVELCESDSKNRARDVGGFLVKMYNCMIDRLLKEI